MIPTRVLLLAVLAGCHRPPECTDSPADLGACVSTSAWEADLVWTARARPPGSEHWAAVQDRCAGRFAELGLDVERHSYDSGVNVVGTLPGEVSPDEWVLVTHGDLLCTKDRPYQRMRAMLRLPLITALSRILPLAVANAVAGRLRRVSKTAVAAKAPRTYDLAPEALSSGGRGVYWLYRHCAGRRP